jgi:hypothetical protein
VSDTTKDIDSLAFFLEKVGEGYPMRCDPEDASPWSRAIAALVAERDELKARVENLKAVNGTYASIVSERDALKQRVAELEAQNPSDCEVLQAVMMNREAELRVTCSALAGIYSNPNGVGDPVRNGQIAAAAAKAALDALSQPRAWSTCDPVRDLCGDRESDLDGEALAAMRKGVQDGN